jgi:hypothetical protein
MSINRCQSTEAGTLLPSDSEISALFSRSNTSQPLNSSMPIRTRRNHRACCSGGVPAAESPDRGDTVADTVSKVIHERRKKAAGKPCSQSAPIVDNFAGKEMSVVKNLAPRDSCAERKAPRPARSTVASPWRVSCRTPAGHRTPVRRSERTSSREDPCISSTRRQEACATATPINPKAKNETME